MCLRPAARPAIPQFLPITQTANLSLRERKRKAKQDPYKYAQAQQRKNVNLKRRGELEAERNAGWGDAVWGKDTPFVKSLAATNKEFVAQGGLDASKPVEAQDRLRNFFLTDAELERAGERAFALSKPVSGVVDWQMDPAQKEKELDTLHQEKHDRAMEALKRITSLRNSSAKDRYHVNVRRIIEEFGRHKTDGVLAPKPDSINPSTAAEVPRGGPDTGSSEVQIGILTAKIRNLAGVLEQNRGHKDKHNKRNLRVLVHKRQRLLKYMERKERGSERWTNMIEKLGLTPATWKGQISM